jgi:hypothetical protein
MREGAVIISAAVEGLIDESVVRKLIVEAGCKPGTVYGKSGKSFLRRQIQGYNNAARHLPWMVLVDLDHDADCAPPLCREWVPDPAQYLCFRVAVREVEAWLMADADALATFLSVARSRIPADPEKLLEPKTEMVNLARHSRRWDIRADMVPRERSGRSVGPAYASRLIEFVQTLWRPKVAIERAESLKRAIKCLKRIIGRMKV